jgi:GrpB-like predicted nucleotidyltransferase (UPF0157 family)
MNSPDHPGSSSKIVVQDYDPDWPQLFERLRLRISVALGPIAAAIEHVGSTSVSGLAAKPTIDIDVLLRSAADLPLAIARLASIGYVHRGDLGVIGREAFRTPPNDLPHHLYVCPPENQEYRRHISFRDYLRAHSEDARRYASLKRELAARYGNDRETYNQGKSKFVEEILQRAEDCDPHMNPK